MSIEHLPEAVKLKELRDTSIVTNERQLDQVADEVIDALVANNDPPELFTRGGQTTSVRRDETGLARITSLSDVAILDVMAVAARFVHIVAKKKEEGGGIRHKNVFPSRELAAVVRKRAARMEQVFMPLRSISETPILRPDGSIVVRPGYDSETGIYHVPAPGLRVPEVPEKPKANEVEKAVELLEELLCDFPFENDASRAHALAALLTIVLRDFICDPVPAFGLDAPVRGSGKGLLASVISILGTGRPDAAKMPDTRSEEEWRKRIMTMLHDGARVCILDNVEHPIRSPSLAALITSDSYTDRILGRTESAMYLNRTTWLATGNNLRLAGDMPRRFVISRINPEMEMPWRRKESDFRHPNLVQYTRENRGELLWAIYVLVRLWVSRGQPAPQDVPSYGGFERWRLVIGGILEAAEISGLLENQDEMLALADEESAEWATFLGAWLDRYGERGVLAKDVVRDIRGDQAPDLRESLPSQIREKLESAQSSTALGQALSARREQVFRLLDHEQGGKAMIVRAGELRHAARWKVQRVTEVTEKDLAPA